MGSTQSSDSFDLYEHLGDSWGLVFMVSIYCKCRTYLVHNICEATQHRIVFSIIELQHPGDFTPVCTTELGQAQKSKGEFDKRNVKCCGFSCNDAESHRGWYVL